MEKYFDQGDLTEDEIWSALRKATCTREFVPVYCGSACKE